MQTPFMIVRHSRKEQSVRISIEKFGYDLTNYSYLRMSTVSPSMAEWVWTEDLEKYKLLESN